MTFKILHIFHAFAWHAACNVATLQLAFEGHTCTHTQTHAHSHTHAHTHRFGS